jgi:hypothetical protein
MRWRQAYGEQRGVAQHAIGQAERAVDQLRYESDGEKRTLALPNVCWLTALLTKPHSRSRKCLICCLLNTAEYKSSKDSDGDGPNARKDEGSHDPPSLLLLPKAPDVFCSRNSQTSNEDCVNLE